MTSLLPSASVDLAERGGRPIGHYRGYAVTYGVLIAVSVITIGLSIAVA